MANGKRRRRTRANRSRKSNMRRSHRNPFFGKRRRMGGHRRSHRNPSVAGFSTTELLKLALGAGGGVIGSKYLTQLALGSNNSGIVGYGAQAVVTLALAWGAVKAGFGKDTATGIVAGGLGAVALRIYNDNVSGSSGAAGAMSGLGDPDMGRLGIGLGDYRDGSSPIPVYNFSNPSAALATAVQPVPGGPVVMPRKRG